MLSAQEKEALGSRIPPSTELSPGSCARVETLPMEMVAEDAPSMGNSLRMRTSSLNILDLVNNMKSNPVHAATL